jgi:hypothetical protein
MKILSLFRIALIAVLVLGVHFSAQAQTPQQIQALIASGQEQAALGELTGVLHAHPDSGVAWYLSAEAQDAAGNEDAARSALAKAEQFAPGLPFAQTDKVAALRAHLAAPAARSGFGISPLAVIALLVGLFLLLRLFFRSRRAMQPPGFQSGFGNRPPAGPFPYGPGGGMGYGPGAGMAGGGIGSSLLTGLAAGAGLAAGERIIDGMMGGAGNERTIDASPSYDPTPVPDRDDGLQGSPDWDAGNSAPDTGDFDNNNSW